MIDNIFYNGGDRNGDTPQQHHHPRHKSSFISELTISPIRNKRFRQRKRKKTSDSPTTTKGNKDKGVEYHDTSINSSNYSFIVDSDDYKDNNDHSKDEESKILPSQQQKQKHIIDDEDNDTQFKDLSLEEERGGDQSPIYQENDEDGDNEAEENGGKDDDDDDESDDNERSFTSSYKVMESPPGSSYRRRPAYLDEDQESSLEYKDYEDDDSIDEESIDLKDAGEGLKKNQISKALSAGEETDSDEYNVDETDPKKRITEFNKVIALQEAESDEDEYQYYDGDEGEEPMLLEGAQEEEVEVLDNVFSRARKNLHISTIPDKLPGREPEIKKLYTTLQSRLMDVNGTGQCIYIAGMPGTGKTSTVKEVIRMMEGEMKKKQLPNFEFVELNCMELSDPHQLYIALYKKLVKRNIKQKLSVTRAMDLLQNYLSPKNSRRTVFRIVLVDEFDQLLTKHQTVIYHLFDWPRRTKSYLIVIAIANTMNLPDALLPRVKSRLGNFRIPFKSYTTAQISTIMKSRLDGLEAFDNEAIELCAKKVAGFCGDARRALEICRKATEVAELEWNEKIERNETNKHLPHLPADQLVKIEHIEAVLEMFMSPITNIIRESSFMEKVFLYSFYEAQKSHRAQDIAFGIISQKVKDLCRINGEIIPNGQQLIRMCASLAASKLILTMDCVMDDNQLLKLNVTVDDLLFALNQDMGMQYFINHSHNSQMDDNTDKNNKKKDGEQDDEEEGYEYEDRAGDDEVE